MAKTEEIKSEGKSEDVFKTYNNIEDEIKNTKKKRKEGLSKLNPISKINGAIAVAVLIGIVSGPIGWGIAAGALIFGLTRFVYGGLKLNKANKKYKKLKEEKKKIQKHTIKTGQKEDTELDLTKSEDKNINPNKPDSRSELKGEELSKSTTEQQKAEPIYEEIGEELEYSGFKKEKLKSEKTHTKKDKTDEILQSRKSLAALHTVDSHDSFLHNVHKVETQRSSLKSIYGEASGQKGKTPPSVKPSDEVSAKGRRFSKLTFTSNSLSKKGVSYREKEKRTIRVKNERKLSGLAKGKTL